jgi:Tfp pilus assembly protein PilN
VSPPLNLARQPFRNERVPTVALAAGCFGLLVSSASHVLVARDLAPGRSRDVASEVVALEREIDDLRAESSRLRTVDAPLDKVKEWSAVKTLVDRRLFSWTRLFASLEEALPPGVRLVSVSPAEGSGGTELTLAAIGRGNEDALALMASLQAHPDFEGAFVNGWNEGRDGFDISCSVRYTPKPRPAGKAGPAAGEAAREAADAEQPEEAGE